MNFSPCSHFLSLPKIEFSDCHRRTSAEPCQPEKRKPLTRSERHTAYIILLAEVERKQKDCASAYMCVIIDSLDVGVTMEDLPELWKKEPLNAGYAWFEGGNYRARIKILKACIEETY